MTICTVLGGTGFVPSIPIRRVGTRALPCGAFPGRGPPVATVGCRVSSVVRGISMRRTDATKRVPPFAAFAFFVAKKHTGTGKLPVLPRCGHAGARLPVSSVLRGDVFVRFADAPTAIRGFFDRLTG